jgi:hypothetical protein
VSCAECLPGAGGGGGGGTVRGPIAVALIVCCRVRRRRHHRTVEISSWAPTALQRRWEFHPLRRDSTSGPIRELLSGPP